MQTRFPQNLNEALQRPLSSLTGCTMLFSCCDKHGELTSCIVAKAGDRTVEDFLSRLTCTRCGSRARLAVLRNQAGERLWLVGEPEIEEAQGDRSRESADLHHAA